MGRREEKGKREAGGENKGDHRARLNEVLLLEKYL